MEKESTSDWLERRRESSRKAARKLRAKRQALADAFYKVRFQRLISKGPFTPIENLNDRQRDQRKRKFSLLFSLSLGVNRP